MTRSSVISFHYPRIEHWSIARRAHFAAMARRFDDEGRCPFWLLVSTRSIHSKANGPARIERRAAWALLLENSDLACDRARPPCPARPRTPRPGAHAASRDRALVARSNRGSRPRPSRTTRGARFA